VSTTLTFPDALYPAFAPLSIPVANHLLHQEEKRYRHRPRMRPTDEALIQAVLARIIRARSIVFEYLNPFLVADEKHQQRGESRRFPSSDFLLETLAHYTPHKMKNAEGTLDHWQQRGLLRRDKARGLLNITSVAALLIARIAEERLKKNWLPLIVEDAEPRWWCYGNESPHALTQPFPLPLPSTFSPSLVLWTPWQGASWEGQWHAFKQRQHLYRWAGSPLLQDLQVWEKELPQKVQNLQHDPFLGRARVQAVLLEEAKQVILENIAEGAVYDRTIGIFH
jgi:hypothetical protein